MPFSESTKAEILANAGSRCECTRQCAHHLGRRCNTYLTAGNWEAHHKTAESVGGKDVTSNGEALCVPCHKNTQSFGRS